MLDVLQDIDSDIRDVLLTQLSNLCTHRSMAIEGKLKIVDENRFKKALFKGTGSAKALRHFRYLPTDPGGPHPGSRPCFVGLQYRDGGLLLPDRSPDRRGGAAGKNTSRLWKRIDHGTFQKTCRGV